MLQGTDLEQLFLAHLAHVNRVVADVCRRSGMGTDLADDCRSWVTLKLLEDDYAILRKFRGESSLKSFLTVVVAKLVRDFRVAQWGRWRPSAAAMRLGALATRLETLIFRDGLSFDEAATVIRSSSTETVSQRELINLFSKLPLRGPVRPREVPEDAAEAALSDATSESRVADEERRQELSEIEGIVARELSQLDAREHTVVRMLLFEGLSVADVARGLGLPQMPLYREIKKLNGRLRAQLEKAGITRERVAAFLNESRT
jgi:RNA polymerase sigma factor for flagellar operon FliA